MFPQGRLRHTEYAYYYGMRGVHRTSTSLVAFVLLITLTSAAVRADDNAGSAPRPFVDGETAILLLEDGGILKGQITQAADWYLVARGGGEMQVAQKRVALVCHTLGDAYEFRRRQIQGDKVADHLRLAEWCIRYELREEAGRELAEARRIDPDQPRLALLERRQEKMGERPVVKESVYLAGANSPAKPQAATATPKAPVASAPIAMHGGDLPNGVVENFTRKVQPVLVNNCSLSGCHQTGSKLSFQLDRALLRGEANRRSTMHNLEAALALVDRAHPDQSPLLTVPRKSHGGTAPIFGPRQQQAYGHLVDWVALISPPLEVPAAAAESADAVEGTTAKVNEDPVQPIAQPVSRLPQRRHADARVAAATDDDFPTTLRPPHRLQVGVQQKSWQPRDAFDPEIFNRGQRARTQANAQAASTSPAIDAATAEQR